MNRVTPGWATLAITIGFHALGLAIAVGVLWQRVGSVEDAQRAGELRLQARITRVETILLSRTADEAQFEVVR